VVVVTSAATFVTHMAMQGPQPPFVGEQVIDEYVHRPEAREHVRLVGEVLAAFDGYIDWHTVQRQRDAMGRAAGGVAWRLADLNQNATVEKATRRDFLRRCSSVVMFSGRCLRPCASRRGRCLSSRHVMTPGCPLSGGPIGRIRFLLETRARALSKRLLCVA
jgi:hypothetical protein